VSNIGPCCDKIVLEDQHLKATPTLQTLAFNGQRGYAVAAKMQALQARERYGQKLRVRPRESLPRRFIVDGRKRGSTAALTVEFKII
jgi:hypothetical protein